MKIEIAAEDFMALYRGRDGSSVLVDELRGELERAGEALHNAAALLKKQGLTHQASEAYQAGSIARALAAKEPAA